jgi:hypothetical protein
VADDAGQGSVELVALLPVLALLALALLQASAAGYAAWSASTAARAGARAAAVGRDPAPAVGRAAPHGGAEGKLDAKPCLTPTSRGRVGLRPARPRPIR